MNKIRKMHNNLREHPKFSPAMRDKQRFNKFEPMIWDEVERIIKGMPTKTCELDTPTTVLLKKSLPHLLPAMSELIKMSVD